MDKAKEALAIVRNGEEIGEKLLILTVPVSLLLLAHFKIVNAEHLSITEMGIRCAASFALEVICDCCKVMIDAAWSIWDTKVQNTFNLWDALNMSSICLLSEGCLLFAILYVLFI